ncbi:MAG TPA: ATP-binding protein, partial [Candidatus Brocadiaceae bacterium]
VQDDLLTQFNAAVFFLMKHLNRRSEIKGVNRKDIYEIPFEALREAIANAIIHRDYSMRGTSLMVEVYDDRVEIINPGVFPGAQKKDFGKISVRRNEHIADLFFRMDKVERAGTGIRRMKEAMATAELPAPHIRQTDFYTITFKRPVEMGVEKGAEDTTQKTAEKTTQKRLVEGLAERLVERLVESQQRILKLTKENPYISKKELAEIIGISTTAIDKNIKQLKKKGLLKRIGPDKGGHWEIVDV